MMPLSHFGEFDCDSTAKQIAAQSLQSLRGVSIESQSMANLLRMRCELISTSVEEKNIHLHDKKAGKIKEKSLLRRLIKLITSDKDLNFSESFNFAANKQHERRPKNQNRKEK